MNIKVTIDSKYDNLEIEIKCKEMNEEVNNIINLLTNNSNIDKLVGVKDGNKYIISLKDIVAIYSNNKKIYIKTKENIEYMIKEKLYELEYLLMNKGFMRISNSEIININEIKKLDFSFGGNIKIVTKTGYFSYVSRNYLKKFKTYFKI